MLSFKPRNFREWCNKTIPILPQAYGDELSYFELLNKVIEKLNEVGITVNELIEYVNHYFDSFDVQQMINDKLDEMAQDGTLENLINNVLFKEYAYFNMEQINPSPIDELELEQMYSNLITNYKDNEFFEYAKVGQSVCGTPIYDFMIGKGEKYNVLAFGNHHGREYQSVYVLYNTIRYIMQNINNKSTVRGYTLNEIFSELKLHIVLSFNPDVYSFIINKNNFYNLPNNVQTNIRLWLENYIKAGKLNVGTDVTQEEYDKILIKCNGDISKYVFSIDELHIWKSNANGVDLHYNAWNANNESAVKSWATSQGWSTSPSPESYIGESGFSEPENIALLNLINSYNIRDIINLHQRGPTLFYSYKYGGEMYARNTAIAENLGRVTQTPVSKNNNGRVGFTGWFYANYEGFCCLKEIGWSYSSHFPNGSYDDKSTLTINPLPTSTLIELYENEKNLLIYYCEFYGRKMDNWCNYSALHSVDVAGNNSQLNADDRYYVISLDYLLRNYKRTLTEADENDTLLTLGKKNAVGTRHVMYLSADSYPNIQRPSDSPTQAGTLIRDSAGTMFIYHFYPIGFNQEYMCTGYSNNIGMWKRIDTQQQ